MVKLIFFVFLFAAIASSFAIDSKCLDPVETGVCKAAMRRYAYKGPKEGCSLFIYGGCTGNRNNFNTLQECQAACS